MRLFRSVATVALATALVTAGAPVAVAEDDRTMTFLIPNLANPTSPPCETTVGMSGYPWPERPAGVIDESYSVMVQSETQWCETVDWHTRVTIIDESPGHSTRAVSADGEPGNPSVASAHQDVPYGIGVREVGVVTFQTEAWSDIGEVCAQERFVIDAVTWEPRWTRSDVPC